MNEIDQAKKERLMALSKNVQDTANNLADACRRLVVAHDGYVSGAVAKQVISGVLEASMNFIEACGAVHDAGGEINLITKADLDRARETETPAGPMVN